MSFDNLDDVLAKGKEDITADAANVASSLGQSDTTGEASQEQCKKVLIRISKESGDQAKVKPQQVMFATVCLVQRGATSPRTLAAKKSGFWNSYCNGRFIKKNLQRRMTNGKTIYKRNERQDCRYYGRYGRTRSRRQPP